jgi:hypothetical protein
VKFSPSGKFSFAIGHDSTLYYIDNANLNIKQFKMKINSCSKVIPLSDYLVILITFDNEIHKYIYEEDHWNLLKILSVPSNSETSKLSSIDTKTNTILSKVKDFEDSRMKKNSLYTKAVPRKESRIAHSSSITSAVVFINKLITTDASGFIKEWDI